MFASSSEISVLITRKNVIDKVADDIKISIDFERNKNSKDRIKILFIIIQHHIDKDNILKKLPCINKQRILTIISIKT